MSVSRGRGTGGLAATLISYIVHCVPFGLVAGGIGTVMPKLSSTSNLATRYSAFTGSLIGCAYLLALGWIVGQTVALVYNRAVARAEA